MKIIRMIALFLWIGVLPVSLQAQVWFPEGSEPEQPFEMEVTVTFPTAGYSVTNYTVDVSGMNIDIRLFTPASTTGYVAQVVTHEQAVIQIPALPEGKYTCHLTVSGKGTIYPDTIEFSVPQPAGSYIGDPFLFFGQDLPTLKKTNRVFRYKHPQLANVSGLVYMAEACTNLTMQEWVPLANATTNITGGLYNEITYDVPATNSQTYIRVRILMADRPPL